VKYGIEWMMIDDVLDVEFLLIKNTGLIDTIYTLGEQTFSHNYPNDPVEFQYGGQLKPARPELAVYTPDPRGAPIFAIEGPQKEKYWKILEKKTVSYYARCE
jgi:hypothetical protein